MAKSERCGERGKGQGERWKRKWRKDDIPSSFFKTRSTAPEQPLQDMLTLNLYVCSKSAILKCVVGCSCEVER